MSTTNYADLHATAETKFITVNGTQYAYRQFGKQGGTPVVFLHHFTASIDDWDPAITNGFAKEFEVILFDNTGIGASAGKTPDNVPAMAHDATAFIKALGLKKIHLFGFSLGGAVAQEIAITSPELIDKLILAGTGPKGSEGLADIQSVLGKAFSTKDDPRMFLFYTQSDFSRNLGQQALTRIKSRTVNRVPNTVNESVGAQLKAILDWAQPSASTIEKLKQVQHPALVVNGNDDLFFPTINSYNLYQLLPNARLSLYPDSGHGAIFQYHELFVNESITFLNGK